jgi:hypothetical protein
MKTTIVIIRLSTAMACLTMAAQPPQAAVKSGTEERGCRSIRPSPFPEESGCVWYFCGFDQNAAGGIGATGPTAWTYQGTLPPFIKDAP